MSTQQIEPDGQASPSQNRNSGNGLWATWSVAGILLAALSLTGFVAGTFDLGFGSMTDALMTWYNDLVTGIAARFIEPGLQIILLQLGIKIELNDQWAHILILLSLYFSAQVASARRDSLHGAAWFYWFWGLVISVPTSVCVGALSIDDPASQSFTFLLPVLAIALFVTGNSFRSALWYRSEGAAFWSSFGSPMRHAVRMALFALLLLALGLLWTRLTHATPKAHWGLVLLIVFMLTLAVYRICINQDWVRGAADRSKSWLWRARNSRQAHVGWAMIAAMTVALAICVLGVGENYLMSPR